MDLLIHNPNDAAVLAFQAVAGDLVFDGSEFFIATGAVAIRQHIRARLQTFLGEWFLDQRIGIPYFQQILIKNPDTNVVDIIYRQAILETPGVASLDELTLDFDTASRSLSVSFKATLDDLNEPLLFDEVFIIRI